MDCVIKRRKRFGISSLLEYSGVFSECGFLFSILLSQCQVFVTTPLFKKNHFCYYTYFVCVWMSVYKYMCVFVSEGNLWVGPRDQTQVVSLSSWHLHSWYVYFN